MILQHTFWNFLEYMESSAAYICKTIEVFQMKIKVLIANKLAFCK